MTGPEAAALVITGAAVVVALIWALTDWRK